MKLQGTMPMYFNGAKISDKLYKMLRDHQVGAGGGVSPERGISIVRSLRSEAVLSFVKHSRAEIRQRWRRGVGSSFGLLMAGFCREENGSARALFAIFAVRLSGSSF